MDEGHHRVRRLAGGIAVLGIAAGLVAGGYALGYDNGRESARADAEAVPSPVETIPAGTSGGGDPVAEGEQVFASVACGSCHVLEAAGTAGQSGPSLDETKPSRETVIAVVTNGRGGMPPFSHLLEPEQIAAVAAYVSTVAGR